MSRIVASVIALLGGLSIAQAGVEVGGTVGAHTFSESDKLGMVSGPQATSLGNSTMFGIRLGVYISSNLGIEAEGGMIPAETRMIPLQDVYAIALRGNVVYQFRADTSSALVPFVIAGAGVLDVVSTKDANIFKKDLVVAPELGFGGKYRAPGDWGVRVDVRALLPPKQGGGVVVDFEVLLSLYKEFGRAHTVKVEEPTAPTSKEADADNDGIPDSKDKCPKEAEDKDGFQDDDGCPDLDNDGDGIPDTADKCPMEPEDKDGFQDDDGCPDPDNDNDGVPDAADKCPDQAETKNGFADDDGCPDDLPEALKAVLAPLPGVGFKANTADFAGGATAALDKVATVLASPDVKSVKIEIAAHTDDRPPAKGSKLADNAALSQARADAVKAYLVKKGVEEARLTAKGYGDTAPLDDPKDLKGGKLDAARKKNARVELKLETGEVATPAPDKQAPAPDKQAPAPAPDKQAPAPAAPKQ